MTPDCSIRTSTRRCKTGGGTIYAVVAYDRGDEIAGIFPGENTKTVRVLSTGAVDHDINVAVVTPNARAAGYVAPTNGVEATAYEGSGIRMDAVCTSGRSETQRATAIGSRSRTTQMDSIDNNKNGKIDLQDSTEWRRITSSYTIQDLEEQSEDFVSQDTVSVSLLRKNLVAGTVTVTNAQGTVVAPANYILNMTRGAIRGKSPGSLPAGKYTDEVPVLSCLPESESPGIGVSYRRTPSRISSTA